MFRLPDAKTVERNPGQERLRQLAVAVMPRLTKTEFENLNYQAEVTARLNNSTFFVSDRDIQQNRISRAEADEWAARQDAYIALQQQRGFLAARRGDDEVNVVGHAVHAENSGGRGADRAPNFGFGNGRPGVLVGHDIEAQVKPFQRHTFE